MKQKLRMWAEWFKGMCKKLLPLLKLTLPMVARSIETVLGCLVVLTAVAMLYTAHDMLQWQKEAGLFLQLADGIVLTPAVMCMLTYAVGACWERRNVKLLDAAHLVRIRIREILLTALAAGLIGMGVNWIGTLLGTLVEALALLGWIPVVGNVIAATIAGTLWLISLLMEFVVHGVLVMSMTALTTDGVTGHAQVTRVLSVVRGGWKNMRDELILVFGLWIAVRGACEVLAQLGMPLGTMLAWDVVNALMLVLSGAAIALIYLKQRDCQDGTSYYA